MIAVLLHFLVLTVLTVIHLSKEKAVDQAAPTQITLNAPRTVEPVADTPPPEIIDRNQVPVLDNEQEGPVNPDRELHPRRDAGSPGRDHPRPARPDEGPGIYNPDPEALSEPAERRDRWHRDRRRDARPPRQRRVRPSRAGAQAAAAGAAAVSARSGGGGRGGGKRPSRS